MFDKIKELLVQRGYNEEAANKIAEIITDYGWTDIRDILNSLDDNN